MVDINIGEITESLNNKVDLSGINVSEDFYKNIWAKASPDILPLREDGAWLYGYYIDDSEDNERHMVQYIPGTDNYFYVPAAMDFISGRFEYGDWENAPFMPKPCMLTYSGMRDYYLSPLDYTKKLDGTPSDITNLNYTGNAMMEFPCVFQKKYRKGSRIYTLLSNKKLDNEFECFPCLKEDGTYADYFYVAIYEGVIDSMDRLRSISTNTIPNTSYTAIQEATAAELNGEGWQVGLWADRDLITSLYILMFKRLNSQLAVGYGGGGKLGGHSEAFLKTGAMNQKGLFWGADSDDEGVKVFGIENLWGHCRKRINGLIIKDSSYYVKMCKSTSDGSTVSQYNHTGDGYIPINNILSTGAGKVISRINDNKYGSLPLYGEDIAETIKFCDEISTSENSFVSQAVVGNGFPDGLECGIFAIANSVSVSYSSARYGTYLSYKGF